MTCPSLSGSDRESACADVPAIGVVLVCFNSGDVILDCIESLLAQSGVRLYVVVVDNSSPDDSVDVIRSWADGTLPWRNPGDLPFDLAAVRKPVPLLETFEPVQPIPAPGVTLIRSRVNTGYAGGVNAGLECLARVPQLERFWILNPDSIVPDGTAAAFATLGGADLAFSIMGGRVNYVETPDMIQIDGGRVDWRSGMTLNVHLGKSHQGTPPPDPATFDFITGASMVVSRTFYERAGPMTEDYFLYFEEVDWAMKRGNLPLAYCPAGIVYHRAGTSIGSPTMSRVASPFSLYFKHRNRIRFLRRHRPRSLLTAHFFTVAKSAQTLLKGYPHEAWVTLKAGFGGRPTPDVAARIAPEAAELAFGKAEAK